MINQSVSVADAFDNDGLLASVIEGFQPRLPQQQMANAIEDAIHNKKKLVVEAGTGTGKTFAYLVPALLAEEKVLIATGTKHLQDQLFYRDLPQITRALKQSPHVALLKGRSNYLCLQRLHNYYEQAYFSSREILAQLQQIKKWSATTTTGDINELNSIPEDAAAWPYATSTVDNCLGQNCSFYSKCFVNKARRKAQEADIVVVNHHLFFADLALRDTGFAELLPVFDTVIFDEAHQLADTATQFFGDSLSSRQLSMFTQDVIAAQRQHAADLKPLSELMLSLQNALRNMRAAFGPLEQKQGWHTIQHKPQLNIAIQDLHKLLQECHIELGKAAPRHQEFEHYWQRSTELLAKFKRLTDAAPGNQIHWYQTFPNNFVIHFTPTVIAENMQAILTEEKTWIFTSATLTVNQEFNYFTETLGVKSAETLMLASPFNYADQALLYLPLDMPYPQQYDFITKLVQAALPIIHACQGRCFFLFTSYAALNQATELLKQQQLPYPLLVQGSKPKSALLAEYKRLGNAVLLGTQSFWEGVDVRGSALSCVIIDKLPFASPEEPILKGRINLMRRQGLDAFHHYQIPQAVIMLKQGVGRLIRDVSDKGLLVIGDPRLHKENYGKLFLGSLPTVSYTQDVTEVMEFLERILKNS